MRSIAEGTVIKARIRHQQKVKEDWLRSRYRALDYYYGRTNDRTLQMFNPRFREKVPVTNNNITRRIIDRTSLVYMVPPDRSVNYNDYADLTQAKAGKLQRAERYTNLLKLIVIHPTFRRGRMDYDLIVNFEPILAADDPLYMIGIKYPLAVSSEVKNTDQQQYAEWTTESYRVTNESGSTLEEDVNPYGLLPFVPVFADGVPETEFLDVAPSNDLVDNNHVLNVLMTAMNANILFQSFGYPWISGVDTDDKLTVSPEELLTLPEGAQMGFATPPDTVSSVRDGVKFIYQSTAQNYHLSASFVEGTTAESGVALRIRNQELMEDRKTDLVLWREVENQIYEIERAILKVNKGVALPEDFAVDFHESAEVLTPQEQREKNDWDLSHNLTTEAEIMLLRNPDLETVEVAQSIIDQNRLANGIKPPAPALSEILAGGPE